MFPFWLIVSEATKKKEKALPARTGLRPEKHRAVNVMGVMERMLAWSCIILADICVLGRSTPSVRLLDLGHKCCIISF